MHAFGITGNGHKSFFDEMEDVITDSPIFIETEHLIRIIEGYAEVDRGSPAFYSLLVEKIIGRGLDQLAPV
jgi:hypothetical protein